MKIIALLFSVLALISGCSTVPPDTKIPIPVQCKTEEPEPPSYRYLPPYTNVFDAVKDLLGDRELSIAYQKELLVSLKSCK